MPSVEYSAADTPRRLLRQMRMRRKSFTIPDILSSLQGISQKSAGNFVKKLQRHGFLSPIEGRVSGRPGSHQAYRVSADLGPEVPAVCPRCKNRLHKPCEPTSNDPASRPEWHKLPSALVRRLENQHDPY